MTEQEMLTRIAELEAENSELAKKVESAKAGAVRKAVPDSVLEKYPELNGVLYKRTVNAKLKSHNGKQWMFIHDNDQTSLLIRRVLFGRGHRTKMTRYPIKLERLDNKQYDLHVETLDMILAVLSAEKQKTDKLKGDDGNESAVGQQ